MASQSVTSANSRLAQMQMRFQQRQLQEREQRRLEMTEETSSDSTLSTKNGKVRQMFDERRRGAGIDRGNPLKPIAATSTSERSRKPPPVPPKKRSTAAAGNGRNTLLVSGSGSGNNNNSSITDSFTKGFSSLSLSDTSTRSNGQAFGDRNNNSSSKRSISSTDSYPRAKSSNSIKLNPLVTKKKSPPPKVRPYPSTNPMPQKSKSHGSARSGSGHKSSEQPSSGTSVKTTARRTVAIMSSKNTGSRQSVSRDNGPPPSGMGTCRFCQRHFYTERLGKHEQICERMAQTKRKIFDAARHRIRGTDAEKYLKKGATRPDASAQKPSYTSAAAASGLTLPPNSALKKNNWRKKHEEFIAAIRAAKQVQAHLARGGKLSDLPPPPPSENPDYVQCPHCLRRFNEAAAERHIPRCATMIHNKPKPGQPPNARRR